jgi:hypothetical protein
VHEGIPEVQDQESDEELVNESAKEISEIVITDTVAAITSETIIEISVEQDTAGNDANEIEPLTIATPLEDEDAQGGTTT